MVLLRKKTALLWGFVAAAVALLAHQDAQVQAFGFGFGGHQEEVGHDHDHHEHADLYDGTERVTTDDGSVVTVHV